MKKLNHKLLERLFKMKESELIAYLPKYLTSNGYRNIIANDDCIYAKGNIPIMLVAHLDTVHKTMPKDIYYDEKKGVLWSPEGLGADDRAGVYGCLQLLHHKPHILFTTGEEKGGIGATVASTDINMSGKLKFIIELDRQDRDDAVFYDCDNPEFTKYIKSFGFKDSWGTFSDISILAPYWGVAAVNLSIGYTRQHTLMETLNANHMQETIDKVNQILSLHHSAEWYEYVEKVHQWKYQNYGQYKAWSKYYSLKYGDKDATADEFVCSICGGTMDSKDESTINYGVCVYCDDCFEYCHYCGEAVLNLDMHSESCCKDCFHEMTMILEDGK